MIRLIALVLHWLSESDEIEVIGGPWDGGEVPRGPIGSVSEYITPHGRYRYRCDMWRGKRAWIFVGQKEETCVGK